MSEDAPAQYDRTKIRIGLAIISVVVLLALVMVAVIDAAAGKAVMFAIAALGFVRLFLLTRAMRRESAGG